MQTLTMQALKTWLRDQLWPADYESPPNSFRVEIHDWRAARRQRVAGLVGVALGVVLGVLLARLGVL